MQNSEQRVTRASLLSQKRLNFSINPHQREASKYLARKSCTSSKEANITMMVWTASARYDLVLYFSLL